MPATRQLRRILPYYRPYVGQLVAGLVLVVASTAMVSVIPWLLRQAIDGLRRGDPLSRTWTLAGAMVAVAVFGGALRYGMRELLNSISRWMEYDLGNALYRRLQTLDARWFSARRTGDIMARMTNDLGAVRMAAGPAVMYLTSTMVGGLFALFFMLRISPLLTALALVPMLALPAITLKMAAAIHRRSDAVQEQFSTLTTQAQENIAGARVVRAYRQEEPEIQRFAALNDEYLARNMALARIHGTMFPMFSFLAGLGGVVVVGAGGMLVLSGTITVGSFVAFGLYLGYLTWPLIAFGWVINLFQRGAASMERLSEVLEATSTIRPEPPLRKLPPATAGRRIEFRNVGFHYPASDDAEPRWVLRNVSFVAERGATLGVVGATGSGKSALMDLIPRIYDPQEGEILLDDVPIRSLDLAELRREIGFVQQESTLFSETLAANIAYGATDADSVRWAAQIAQLAEAIESFPGGYETLLGERGINLSGGQKQRASLARALARHPSIVLLDDALSAVDTHTEAAILRELRSALAGRTAVIASHRVSATRDATWIIVLDGGRVVEHGRHQQLMAAEGKYWTLLRRQQLVESIEADDESPVMANAQQTP